MLPLDDLLRRTIQARPGLTQQDLVSCVPATERTIRRHLQALMATGHVVAEREGRWRRYRLADGAEPAAVELAWTEREIEALAVAARAAAPLLAPTPLRYALASAAERLAVAAMDGLVTFEADTDREHWDFEGAAGGRPPDVDARVFRALLDAMRASLAVEATYYTASRGARTTGRRLAPLGFLVRSGGWMVAAVDLDVPTRPVKDFALAGFEEVRLLDDDVVLPPDDFRLERHGRDRFGALDGPVETVRLHVDASVVAYFERKLYSPSQRIEVRHPDASATVTFEAGGLDAVAAWALSWGDKIRVTEPAPLVARVAEAHRAAARRYATPFIPPVP